MNSENNMENLTDKGLKQIIEDVVKEQLKTGLFTARKLTDNPTDDLQVVNRRYTNLNGAVTSRPTSSVASIGQHYFATDTKIPMTYTGTNWVNGVGSVVAST